MKNKRALQKLVWFVLCLGLLVPLLLSACSQPSATTSAATSTSAPVTSPFAAQVQATASAATKPVLAPKPGGILRIMTIFSMVNLGDPAQPAGMGDAGWNQCAIESLVDMDENSQPQPWLATSWNVADDKKSITLNLRKGVKFHDGTDFNADAVKFNLDRYLQSTQTVLKAVSSVDVVDDYTVRLNLSSYDVSLFYNLASRATGMISPTAVKLHGKDWLLTNIVGTGPFKFTKYDRDALLKFDRNPDYWNKPRPYLDGVEIIIIANSQTAQMSFEAGEADCLSIAGQKASELIDKGFPFATGVPPVTSVGADGGNAASPFADIRVRQALSYAIDGAAIAKAVGFGRYDPAYQLAVPGSWSYNPQVKGYPFNPDKAKQLLKDAGYPNGFQMTFYSGATIPYRDSVQAYLKDVGIDFKPETVTQARQTDLENKGWQNGAMNVFTSVGVPTMDPSTALYNSVASMGNRYVSLYHPKEVDDKIAQALVEFDLNKRKALIQDLGYLIIDKYSLVTPIYLAPNNCVMSKAIKIHDLRLSEAPYPRWRPDIAWIEK